jgi:hypothetical protein
MRIRICVEEEDPCSRVRDEEVARVGRGELGRDDVVGDLYIVVKGQLETS